MRFVIPRGRDFYCEFTVKEPGASIPMDLTGATGVFNLSSIGPNPCIVITDQPLLFPDPENGIASVSLTAEQTSDLVSRRGLPEDGYPIVPTYRGSLDITVEDPIYVEIPQIYISDEGDGCPVPS